MTMTIVAGFHVKRICVSTSARRHASLLFSNKLNCIETLTQFQIQILLVNDYMQGITLSCDLLAKKVSSRHFPAQSRTRDEFSLRYA